MEQTFHARDMPSDKSSLTGEPKVGAFHLLALGTRRMARGWEAVTFNSNGQVRTLRSVLLSRDLDQSEENHRWKLLVEEQ